MWECYAIDAAGNVVALFGRGSQFWALMLANVWNRNYAADGLTRRAIIRPYDPRRKNF